MNADSITSRNARGTPSRALATTRGKQDRQLAAIVDTASKLAREQRPAGRRRPRRARQPRDPGILGAPGSRMVLDKPGRNTVIEGDDFITEILVTSGEGTYAVPINPGIPTSFPIASAEAKVYERYVFEQLEYYLVPTVTEFGASEGQVILMCSYDADDPEPPSITAVLNNIPRAEGMPYHLLRLPLAKSRLNGKEGKFIRTDLVLPTGTDIKTYDAGVVYVFASGISGPNLPTSNARIAKLHVKYRLRLLNQQVVQNQGVTSLPPRNFQYSNYTSTISNTGVHFPDYAGGGWSDFTSFVNSGDAHYWDFGRQPEPVNYDIVDAYAPLGDLSGGFGKIFDSAGAFSVPQGRYLFTANVTINADNHDSDPGNVDFFRIMLIRTGDEANSFPFFGKELSLTHHQEPVSGYDFSFRGGSVDLIGCIPGPADYTLMYQLGTDANQGAAVYWTISIAAL